MLLATKRDALQFDAATARMLRVSIEHSVALLFTNMPKFAAELVHVTVCVAKRLHYTSIFSFSLFRNERTMRKVLGGRCKAHDAARVPFMACYASGGWEQKQNTNQ